METAQFRCQNTLAYLKNMALLLTRQKQTGENRDKNNIKKKHCHYCRVIRLAGNNGTLTKGTFIKILKSSDFFMKAFDKNKDGIVTEVKTQKSTLCFFLLP